MVWITALLLGIIILWLDELERRQRRRFAARLAAARQRALDVGAPPANE